MRYARLLLRSEIDGPDVYVILLSNITNLQVSNNIQEVSDTVSTGVKVISEVIAKGRSITMKIIVSNINVDSPNRQIETLPSIDMALQENNFPKYKQMVELLETHYIRLETNMPQTGTIENLTLKSWDTPISDAYGGFEATLIFSEFLIAEIETEEASIIKKTKQAPSSSTGISGLASFKSFQTEQTSDFKPPDIPDRDSLAVDAVQAYKNDGVKGILKFIKGTVQ